MVYLLVICLLLVIGFCGWGLDRRRIRKLEAASKVLGFTFRKAATDRDVAIVAQSHLSSFGSRRHMSNVGEASTSENGRIVFFDFSEHTGSGKGARGTWETIIQIQSPKLNLPQFFLRPKSMRSKAAPLFGGSDFFFPERRKFSKMYLLRGIDGPTLRRTFTPGIIEYCEAHPKLCIEGAGNGLLIYRLNRETKPKKLEAFLNEGKRIKALFKTSSTGI
jgi:hypothetical protein